jgi:hypothetical protein
MVSGENSVQCPENNCGPRAARDRTGHIVGIVIFDSNAYLDNRGIGGTGSAGFIPAGSTYTGNGQTVGGGISYPDGLPSGGGRSMYDFSSHARNPQETYPGVLVNIRTLNTGGNTAFERHEADVLTIIQRMAFSAKCAAAFKRAGLPTVDALIQKGFTIGSRSALADSRYTKALGISENNRIKYNNEERGAATTIMGGATGRPVILFAVDAFNSEKNDLSEVIAHEFIHAGGVGSKPGFWGPLSHDLKGFDGYDDIIENCK